MDEILTMVRELDELARKLLYSSDPTLRGEVSGQATLLKIKIEIAAKYGLDTRR